MKKNSINKQISAASLLISASILISGCAMERKPILSTPAEEYSLKIKNDPTFNPVTAVASAAATVDDQRLMMADAGRAQLKLVNDYRPVSSDFQQHPSTNPLIRDYQGPLDLGDPGVQASLWKESRSANDMLRDDRAWQAGDLITIRVNENDIGVRQARTDSKSESTIGAALQNFFGIAEKFYESNSDVQGGALIQGTSKEEFKGQGLTDRRSQLTARLSVMVAEVLPTGILRVEGKKIVTVNDEEQMMILSGLIRVRDISYINEVDSSKVANMRIDYYGVGSLGDVQTPGWGTRVIRRLWPF